MYNGAGRLRAYLLSRSCARVQSLDVMSPPSDADRRAGAMTDHLAPAKHQALALSPIGGIRRNKTPSPQQAECSNPCPPRTWGVLEVTPNIALDNSLLQAWVKESLKPNATLAQAKHGTPRKFSFLSNEASLKQAIASNEARSKRERHPQKKTAPQGRLALWKLSSSKAV